MKHTAALALAALSALLPLRATAACTLKEQPVTYVQVEGGVAASTLTQNRGTWHETSLTAVARDGNARSAYARFAAVQRFGLTDDVYEAGAYASVLPKLIVNVTGSYSPQYQNVPHTTVSTGFDARTGGGYGYQVQYASRSFRAANAAITTFGVDRYFKDRRLAASVSLAQLSNVPGTAASVGVSYGRFLPCDTESAGVSFGRDVESAAPGTLAVYRTLSYDVNEVHWLSNRMALNAGAGWDLLIGSYSRFEVRVALRERF